MENRDYKQLDLGVFVKGFKKASDLIKMEGPDFILAPVVGAVPFVDILSIVDRKFPIDSVEYPPNSSRFMEREEIMDRWYSNFYDVNETGDPLNLVCIDEVLSGSSAVKGYRQFKKSLEDRARVKARGMSDESKAFEDFRRRLRKKVNYKIVGIAERGYKRSSSFNSLINQGVVHVVEFDNVPTIDNVLLNPIRLKNGGDRGNGRRGYLPEIETFEITPEYLDFLRNIARYVGADPSKITPVNLSKIEEGLRTSRPIH